MKPNQRRKFAWLILRERLKFALGAFGLFGLIAVLFMFVFTDDFKSETPLSAKLIRQSVVQNDTGHRWYWIVETESGAVLEVRPRAGMQFEPDKEVCIQVRRGERTGLHFARIVDDTQC